MALAVALAVPPAAANRAAAAVPYVPCPYVAVTANPQAPSRPPMPTRNAALPTVGGDGLNTKGLAVPTPAPAPPANMSATSWVVADLDTGDVLGACGPHERGAPASVQKLLLVATVMGKLNPNDVVTVTAEDLKFEPGSSAMGLVLNGKYQVETLWLGLMLNSGNDAANTLARLGGGERGVAGTLADMNAQAHRLGALDTHAATPSGLDGPGQVSSAYDLALIARACFAREDFRRYAATPRAFIPPQPPKDPYGYQIQNDNRLLTQYPGAMGGKTGFTDIARHTFVGAAQRNGRRLVVTMLGAEIKPIRPIEQAEALLDWGFSVPRGSSVGRLVDPGEADRMMVAAAASAGQARRASAGGVGLPGWAFLVGVATATTVIVSVWILVLGRGRRRANRRRALSASRD
jgi:serine-type D-Ala-D-Ala carboxypeptidase (penicillin-binding protein 5/6)